MGCAARRRQITCQSRRSLSGLTDQRITTIARGDGNSLWIGTKNGLNRLDLRTRAIERILPEPANPTALAAGYITSLLTDARGRLWIATFGGGVNILETRGADGRPKFTRLGISQGLNNDNADKLLEDSKHNIWVGTDDGLAVIDEQTLADPSLAARGRPAHFQLLGRLGRCDRAGRDVVRRCWWTDGRAARPVEHAGAINRRL